MRFLWVIVSASVSAVAAPQQASFAAPNRSDDWPPATMNEGPVQLCGLRVSGPQADLDRIQALAAKSGYLTSQLSPPELVVAFPFGSDPKAAAAFTTQLRAANRSSIAIKTQCLPAPP